MERIGAVLVDTYRIERLIAEGGMGAVYEASHLRIPKKFAVKFLKVSLMDNNVALLRFRREAELIATLDHPHIVTLLDYNMTEDGVPYTILEYLEGEHLGDRVNRGRLPFVDVMRITEAVCGGLTAAHEKGIVHRDLKPENVILCAQGAIKVVDFGIAKLRGGQELTAFNSILGTITYMAPEQLLAGKIDARSDQFAIGAMVYEMLSGEMPFGSDGTIPEIAERVLRQNPKPIEGYSSAIHDVLMKAMSKEAQNRYDSVAIFNDELKAATKVTEPVTPSAFPAVPTVIVTTPPKGETIPVSSAVIVTQDKPSTVEVAALDEGLPELPGDNTTISSPNLKSVVEAALRPDEEVPAEATRITRSPEPPLAAPSKKTAKNEVVTGQMGATRPGIGRTALIVGGIVGVVIAVLLSVFLR